MCWLLQSIYLWHEVCMTTLNRSNTFCLIATGSKQLVVADNLSDYYNQQLYPCNNSAEGLICCFTEDTADVLVIKYVMMMIIWWWLCMFAIICWNEIALHLNFSDVFFPEVDVMFENNWCQNAVTSTNVHNYSKLIFLLLFQTR